MEGIANRLHRRTFEDGFEIRTSYQADKAVSNKMDLRAEGDPEKEMHLKCYFAVFGSEYVIWDDPQGKYYETIDRHAFDDTLTEDIRALINHNADLCIGRTTAKTLTLGVDDHGLFGDILINRFDQDAVNLWHRVKRRDVTGNSMGFFILNSVTERRTDEDGREIIHRTLMKILLVEVSPCTFPAYEDTSADAEERKAQRDQKNRDWGLEMIRRLSRKKEETNGT